MPNVFQYLQLNRFRGTTASDDLERKFSDIETRFLDSLSPITPAETELEPRPVFAPNEIAVRLDSNAVHEIASTVDVPIQIDVASSMPSVPVFLEDERSHRRIETILLSKHDHRAFDELPPPFVSDDIETPPAIPAECRNIPVSVTKKSKKDFAFHFDILRASVSFLVVHMKTNFHLDAPDVNLELKHGVVMLRAHFEREMAFSDRELPTLQTVVSRVQQEIHCFGGRVELVHHMSNSSSSRGDISVFISLPENLSTSSIRTTLLDGPPPLPTGISHSV